MKHCILAKFTPEAKAQRAALLPRIREIFSAAADIPGVHGAEVIPNCVDRDHGFCAVLRAGPYHSLQPVGHLFPLYCFGQKL